MQETLWIQGFSHNSMKERTGETAQQLQVLTALAKNLGSVPKTHSIDPSTHRR